MISLMQDQVKALNDVGVHAAFINSALTEGQIRKALSLAAQGVYKIIYVAPERLESWEFLDFATHTEISMVTVDEATASPSGGRFSAQLCENRGFYPKAGKTAGGQRLYGHSH